MMNKPDDFQSDLDQLLLTQPLPKPPTDFSDRVMIQVAQEPLPQPNLWQQSWLQWAAICLGLGLGVMRLAGFIFSAWLALETAL
jgi:hypothetical protein